MGLAQVERLVASKVAYLQLLNYLDSSGCKSGGTSTSSIRCCCCWFRKHRIVASAVSSRRPSLASTDFWWLRGATPPHHAAPAVDRLSFRAVPARRHVGALLLFTCSPDVSHSLVAELTATSHSCKTLDRPTNHVFAGMMAM